MALVLYRLQNIIRSILSEMDIYIYNLVVQIARYLNT
jgi:hypothetical protein